MKDIDVKKREWVKTAAIVFLAVMLLLTFFSNTILNRSLPEVAAQYTQSMSINTRIRGSGTLVPVEAPYEVVSDQSYTVGEVRARVGDMVETGDVLIVLSQSVSEELSMTEKMLYDKELELEMKLLYAPDNSYTDLNNDIRSKRDDLAKAREALALAELELQKVQNDCAAVNYSESLYLNAASLINTAEAQIATRTTELSIAQRNLDLLLDTFADSGGMTEQKRYNDLLRSLNSARSSLTNAQNDLDRLELDLKKLDETDPDPENQAKIAELRAKIETAAALVDTRRTELDIAQRNFDTYVSTYIETGSVTNQASYKELKSTVDEAKTALTQAQNSLDRIRIDSNFAYLESLRTRLAAATGSYSSANDTVTYAQKALDAANQVLADRQKADGTQNTQFNIEVREINKTIDELRDKLEELREGGSSSEITAAVSGRITQVNVTPGHKTTPGLPLMVIEITDRGYTLSMPVTAEQASRVRVGDSAEVDRGWWGWGNPLSAVLTGIRPDPQNPAGGRLLVFTVSGDDIESNTQLNVTIAQQSQNYGVVVPKSAIRSDTNGDFVLIVETRSSPLRNRYIATRVDVTIIASDDVNCAINGAGLTGWDFVITTSNRPIEPGMQVRMVDNP